MKSNNRRNFESCILTNDPRLVQAAMDQFDRVWRGDHCTTCGRKQFCGEPMNEI